MSNGTVNELRKKSEAAWERIRRQLAGMDAHLERTSAPGQWTAREVLCHLLFEPGFRPVGLLERFASTDLPLDSQRREVFAYLEALDEAELRRKARIPLFEPLIGTDEITLPIFVGAMFDRHWNGHADQLAQIRQTVGLPETQ